MPTLRFHCLFRLRMVESGDRFWWIYGRKDGVLGDDEAQLRDENLLFEEVIGYDRWEGSCLVKFCDKEIVNLL